MYQCALSLLHQKQPELSPYVLQERFEDLHQPIPSTLTTISAKKRKNAAANRYSNVLPYDHNCVKVGACGEDVSKRRYINASLLRVRLPLLTLRSSWHSAACVYTLAPTLQGHLLALTQHSVWCPFG